MEPSTAVRPASRRLFGRPAWRKVEAAVSLPDARVLVAFDFDGTIAPIAPRPDRVRVPQATVRLLGRAARLRGIFVAVVTARRRREVARLLPVGRVRCATHYGLEGPAPPPVSKRRLYRARAARIRALLAPVAGASPGAWIEPKGTTVSLHDRRVDASRLPALRRALGRVAAAARHLGFTRVRGRRVTEFVPRGYDKGRALSALRRRLSPARTFYFGDSEADEAAFAILAPEDFGIRVGPGPSRARYRVAGPADVARFLRELISIRAGSIA